CLYRPGGFAAHWAASGGELSDVCDRAGAYRAVRVGGRCGSLRDRAAAWRSLRGGGNRRADGGFDNAGAAQSLRDAEHGRDRMGRNLRLGSGGVAAAASSRWLALTTGGCCGGTGDDGAL